MGLRLFFNDTSKNAKGTAAAADVPSTKTFSNDTQIGIAGTAVDRRGSSLVITPSGASQAIPAGLYGGAAGDGQVAAVSVNAATVLKGTTIAGTAGTAPRRASGVTTVDASGNVVISGLSFQPRYIIVMDYSSSPTQFVKVYNTDSYFSNLNGTRMVYNNATYSLASGAAWTITANGFTCASIGNSGESVHWESEE